MAADPAQELAELKVEIAATKAELKLVKESVPLDIHQRNILQETVLELQKKENRLAALFDAGAGGGLALLSADVMEQFRTIVQEEIRPMKNSMKNVLELMLDPWEMIHSEVTERVINATTPHLAPVSSFYGIPQKRFCMVLGTITHCDIICSHIWPASTYGKGLETTGLTREAVNDPRNFLRLHRAIEKAFDKKRLFFVRDEEVGDEIQLILVIVDPTLHSETYEASNATTLSFATLHNQRFAHRFIPPAKPFLRLLAIHASKAIEKAQAFGWIDAGDVPAQRDRALRLARLSLDPEIVNMIL